MVVALIDERRNELASICRRHGVRRLEVFGSAADGTFDSERSDIDFLVEYGDIQPEDRWEAYFGLWEDLARLLARKIDLVEPGAMRNPYFIRRVNESRVVIYDAGS